MLKYLIRNFAVVSLAGFIWFKAESIIKLRTAKEVSILFSVSFSRTTLLCGGG
jgi:hypothetical protein